MAPPVMITGAVKDAKPFATFLAAKEEVVLMEPLRLVESVPRPAGVTLPLTRS